MDVYARMSDADASDYDKLKKALLTGYRREENDDDQDGDILACLGSLTRRRLRRVLRRNQPSPRKMMTMLDGT